MLVIKSTICTTIVVLLAVIVVGSSIIPDQVNVQATSTSAAESGVRSLDRREDSSLDDGDVSLAAFPRLEWTVKQIGKEHIVRLKQTPRGWSSSRKRNGQFFTEWSTWTSCDENCRQKRERFCKVMRKCADTKHVEERRCPMQRCKEHRVGDPVVTATAAAVADSNHHHLHQSSSSSSTPATTRGHQNTTTARHNVLQQLLPENSSSENSRHRSADDEGTAATIAVDPNKFIPKWSIGRDTDQMDESEIRIVKINHNRKAPPPPSSATSPETQANKLNFARPATTTKSIQIEEQQQHLSKLAMNHFSSQEGGGGNTIQNGSDGWTSSSLLGPLTGDDLVDGPNDDDDYADNDYPGDGFVHIKRQYKHGGGGGGGQSSKKYSAQNNFVAADLKGAYRVYTRWSKWTKCSGKCTTRRFKKCRLKEVCGNEVLREIAYCYTEGSFCEDWIVRQMYSNVPKSPSIQQQQPQQHHVHSTGQNLYSQYPVDSPRNPNNYHERKLPLRGSNSIPQGQCGAVTALANRRRPASHMLRIIGGRVVRKGSYPWQVAILNRFKEAFCGGTLISKQWILTAAHCVRKRLYVRLGEHNLEDRDGTEVEYRVEYAIRHPYYDKTTVDNDIALLRLPKEIIPSAYIGFACLPQKYQRLPIGTKCTIIGWGKRKNLDDAGTKYLHEAQVPIVQNDECKEVYDDYTITKNMFCAGHKRGRIDTCSGDSGGPLLYKDPSTSLWSILGVTSFGDGCGKRNKFGIYTKVSNYVDWIQSVIECNGNCRRF